MSDHEADNVMEDGVTDQRLTSEQARAEYERLVPIMALEGRTMDAHSQEVFVEYLQDKLTIDDLVAIAKRRNGVAE